MSQLPYLLQQAEQAMTDGDWEKAQQQYQQARDLEPNHPRAEQGLRNAQRAVAKEAEIQERMAEADALFAQGNYKGAADAYIAIIDYAVATPRILKFHPDLERKRNQAKGLQTWQERVEKTLAEVHKQSDGGNWEVGAKVAEDMLRQLPQDAIYRPLRNALGDVRKKVLNQGDHQTLLRKAETLFKGKEYAQGITLLETIPQESQFYAQAQQWIGHARGYLESQKRDLAAIETAISESRWTDALAQLEQWRGRYQGVPLWQQLYLQAGTSYGRAQLEAGRQYNEQRNFEQARRQFESAQKIFEKVLEIYTTHIDAQRWRDESIDLVAITTHQAQAQLDWAEGRREDAAQALKLAQQRLAHAKAEGRDYTAVGAVVTTMLSTLESEVARIREEERRLRDAESLWESNRLREARERFHGTLDALLPEHQRWATEGLRRVEAKIQQFEALMMQGKEQNDPLAAVSPHQQAYDLWPDGPGIAGALESALVAACESALNAGRETEAVRYGNRALALNPDNRKAKSLVGKAGAKPQVEATLQQVRSEWANLQQQEHITATALDPLRQNLEAALRKVAEWPDLRADLDALHQTLREAQSAWQDYEQTYARAVQHRDSGAWAEALHVLETAVTTLGDQVPSGAHRQLGVWRETARVLEVARDEANAALKQAQSAYAAAVESDTLGALADALDAVSRQLEPAHKRLRSVEEQVAVAGGPLPEDLADLLKEVKGLSERASAASEAAGAFSASDGLLKIQEVIRVRGGDPTLEAVRAQLEDKAREDIARIKQQAETAIQAGDLTEAEEKLHQVRELDPSDTETAALYADIRQRRQLEARLRQVEREAEGKLAGNSPIDAMKTLRQGLNALLEPDVALPEAAREILSDLIALGDREDGLALGQPENWDTAQALTASLGKLRAENWAAGRAVPLVDQWIRLARDNALRGVVASAAQLGNLIQAYRAAAAYIKAHPTEAFAVEQLTERTEMLINQLNESASKRVQRAQHALENGDFESALHNLKDIEQDFYLPIDQEFPGLLDGQDQVQAVRDEVIQLQEAAQKRQGIYNQARPEVEKARQAYIDGAWDGAEKALEALPALTDLPELEAEVTTLREQIAKARVEQTRGRLHEVMSRIETGRHLATTVAQLEAYLEDMETLQKEINLQVLDVGERSRYFQVLEEVREQREALVAGTIWEQQIEEFMQKQQYADALKAIEKALATTREAGKRVKLEMRRDEIERLAQEQQEREAALNQGHDAFAAEDYAAARQHFDKARRLGADVTEALGAARAGGLLQSARRFWEKERDDESALLDLDELQHFVEGNDYATTVANAARHLRRRIKKAREGTLAVQRALAEARRLLTEGQLSAAQDSVQQILEGDPAFPDALALQKQIQEQAVARAMLDKAHAAQQEGQYKESLQMVNTVLETQPDNPEAKLLQRQLTAVINAGKAVIEVETLAKQHHFKQAREKLTELSRQGVDPDTLRQTQDLVDELEKEQWTRVIHPIQELYRDGEYAEAWNRCKQALGRTAAPELLDELQTLQGLIVNRWAEKQAQAARAQLQKTLAQETLRDLEVQLKPFLLLDPPPEGHWVRQFEDLLRETRTRRLRLRLSQARERYEDWVADDMRGTPQAALDIIKTVQEEAETLGTQVEFDVTLDAASLTAEIQEAMNQRDADARRAERERWMGQALALQAQLEDATYIAEESPGRPELERVAEWAKQVFKISGYENDGQAREVANWAQHALTAFDRTQQALSEAQRLLRQRRFRDAEYELRGTGAVSSLLKVEHERQRELVGALRRAENHQNNEAWDLALQEYRQALTLDPDLEPFLEKEMERCYQRLRERVTMTVEQALNATPPDIVTARAALTQAEASNWITSLVSREYDRLRDWLGSQEYVAQAAELLQAADSDTDAAQQALREARRLLPGDQADTAIDQWETLLEAVRALDAYQHRPSLLPRVLDTFRNLRSPIAELPRVRAVIQELESEAERVRLQKEKQAEEARKREAEAAEKHRLLNILKDGLDAALATPRDYNSAVQLLENASPKITSEPPFVEQCHRVRDDLRMTIESMIKQWHYAEALELAEILRHIPQLDEATRNWAIGLPDERREALNVHLRQAEQALQDLDEYAVRAALQDAETIAEPEGDSRINDLYTRLRDTRLDMTIAEVEKALDAYDPGTAETALEAAKKIAAPQGDARLQTLTERLDALRDLRDRVHNTLRHVGGLMGQKQWAQAVDRLLEARGEAPGYPRVVNAIHDVQDRMKAQAESWHKDGKFIQALDLCDLALLLDTRDDIQAIQQQIRKQQQLALAEVQHNIQTGLDTWQLELLPGLLEQASEISPEDTDTFKLQERYTAIEALLPDLRHAINQGWNALLKRNYPDAIAAFNQALALAPHFSEAQIWHDYAYAMREAARQVQDNEAFERGARLLREAEDLVRVTAAQPLPDILGSATHLQERHRHAVYNAWRLRQSARKLVAFYKATDYYFEQRNNSKMESFYERIAEEKKLFRDFHLKPIAPPDHFSVSGMEDEPLPADTVLPVGTPHPRPSAKEDEVPAVGEENPELEFTANPSMPPPAESSPVPEENEAEEFEESSPGKKKKSLWDRLLGHNKEQLEPDEHTSEAAATSEDAKPVMAPVGPPPKQETKPQSETADPAQSDEQSSATTSPSETPKPPMYDDASTPQTEESQATAPQAPRSSSRDMQEPKEATSEPVPAAPESASVPKPGMHRPQTSSPAPPPPTTSSSADPEETSGADASEDAGEAPSFGSGWGSGFWANADNYSADETENEG